MRTRDEPRYERDVKAQDRDEDAPARRKRSIPDEFFAETDAKRPATEPDAAMEIGTCSPFAEEKKPPRKRPNYLQHDDRRIIIERVARGEPQAALAREYGVTRAAVCQMYKKREKILARGGGALPSQQRGATAASASTTGTPPAVRKPEVKRAPVARRNADALPTVQGESKTVKALVTTLRNERTSSAAFQRAAARLTFILIEAALASYDVPETDQIGCFGCDLFELTQPLSVGQIHVKAVQDNGTTSWKLHYLDVPDNITHVEVLLFSTFGNGGAESKAIEVGKATACYRTR
ncbi:hypothetical protein PHYSODRAFT_500110 [Phytophthora sojae]|uniref:HTH psq-type domain-containing protein n=1 Tax=Phytophthora sojae (strain P6497) TaxID=1094619 RepID=G4ZDP1_PHYSP|nr:hypothetical protein PHYSODRAFT_500110 [Phytophthora sojae]EGZ18380.1 hypothetical protein PHYSODRAFT_500110 [Phytophthora sojae]|eukprot:XP_009527438.1 hypothetical protein PHYSODRAFT_500110 [Phytophthora sojae]